MKKFTSKICSVLLYFCLFLVFNSCKEKTADPSNFLSRSLKGNIWKSYNQATMQLSIRLRLEKQIPSLKYAKLLQSFYERQNYKPVLLERFLENHQLDSLFNYLNNAQEHGFDSKRFKSDEINKLNVALHSGLIKNRIDAYIALSAIELRTAAALSSYGHDLSFGQLDPSKLYKYRFSIKLLKADSAFYDSILETKNLAQELRQMQPIFPLYIQMKDSLAFFRQQQKSKNIPDLNSKISKIRVNMERLRWKHVDTGSSYVLVNIPSFKLYAYENRKIAWSMRVCVGEKKEAGYDEKFKIYLKTHNIDDKPKNHQTPLLTSEFESIQINPKWHIPASILQNELYYKLRKNPNYLAENNMKLFKGNKEVGRLDTIQWDRIARDKIPFNVKQDPGEMNALGKIKFTFDNPYSIYLHDTPTKSPFKRSERDVSHGCVRLGDPLKLASWLSRFNGKNTYDLIRIGIGLAPEDSSVRMMDLFEKRKTLMETEGDHPTTSSIYLKKRTPVFIEYYTCWAEQGQGLVFYDDIYNLDGVIAQSLND